MRECVRSNVLESYLSASVSASQHAGVQAHVSVQASIVASVSECERKRFKTCVRASFRVCNHLACKCA
jgi:hypothetical protein